MNAIETEYDLARRKADELGRLLLPGLMTDSEIRDYIAPRMWHPNEAAGTFSETVSGKGVISYGLSSAGYDFRLGPKVKGFTNAHSPVIDPLRVDERAFVDLLPVSCSLLWPQDNGEDIAKDYQYITIPPRGYVLGETVEYIDIPEDVLIVVLGKSTYARSGIIVNCTPLEPGWRGRVTLEIGNLSEVPAKVYLGMGIAQALFFKLSKKCQKSYARKAGKYQDQKGLEFAKAQ